MLQAESPTQRIMLLQVLQATDDTYSKKFIGFHGLRLLWSWMVDSSDLDSNEGLQFRMQVLMTTKNYKALQNLQKVVKNEDFAVLYAVFMLIKMLDLINARKFAFWDFS